MPLEERIQKSVDSALAGMRARIEDEVQSAIHQIVSAATADRDEAIAAAVESARADAEVGAKHRADEAGERVRASLDELVEQALTNERALAAESLSAALQSSREELKQALTEAQQRADEAVRESVTAARVRERELEMAAISRLLESIRGLDGASSLSEVLDALGQASAREASRTALLVLRSERLLGWKLSGFGTRDAQPKLIDLALAEAGVIGVAVTSARAATTRDSEAAARGPGFAALPDDRMGLGVPVIVGGRVVAVVYTDGVTDDANDKFVPSGWPEVIEILTRHAARCLESLTSQKSASATPSPRLWVPPTSKTSQPEGGEAPAAPEPSGAAKPDAKGGRTTMSQPSDSARPHALEESARRFARLLLSDIKLSHERAVAAALRSRSVLSRLGPEIERARRLYDERVPASLRTRAELFHQELVATLAGGDPALLGSPA